MNKNLVTTDRDLWNSADGSGFFISKGEVKELPEEPTPIIEDAISQRLIREATQEEIDNYKIISDTNKAIQNGIIKPGKNLEESIKIFKKHNNLSDDEDKKNDNKNLEVEKLNNELKLLKDENKKLKEELFLLKDKKNLEESELEKKSEEEKKTTDIKNKPELSKK